MLWGIYNLSKSGTQQCILCFCSCVFSTRKQLLVNIYFVFLGNGKIILENLCLQNVRILSQDMTTCLNALYAVKIFWLFQMFRLFLMCYFIVQTCFIKSPSSVYVCILWEKKMSSNCLFRTFIKLLWNVLKILM
jgi:hypothetical protein